MKTTVEIADPLFERARIVADREGTTLRSLIEEGLRRVVDGYATGKPFTLRDGRFKGRGRGLTPEFTSGGWEPMRRALYEDGA
jgi:hypothetical protein